MKRHLNPPTKKTQIGTTGSLGAKARERETHGASKRVLKKKKRKSWLEKWPENPKRTGEDCQKVLFLIGESEKKADAPRTDFRKLKKIPPLH